MKAPYTRLLALSFSAIIALRIIGALASPYLLAHSPILLILISPLIVNLIAVAALTDPWVFLPAALGISTIQCLIGYGFGATSGPAAQAWVQERSPGMARWFETVIEQLGRAAPLILLLVPGPIVCCLVGFAQVPLSRFLPAMAGAQLIWVGLCLKLGVALTIWIESVQRFALDNALVLTALFFAVYAAIQAWSRFRKGSTDESSHDKP